MLKVIDLKKRTPWDSTLNSENELFKTKVEKKAKKKNNPYTQDLLLPLVKSKKKEKKAVSKSHSQMLLPVNQIFKFSINYRIFQ